MLFHEMIKVMF